MSETITEENTTTEENITTIDHASATETISGQKDTSAAENASGQEDTSASSSTTIQKDTSASGSTTARKNASVINNATAPGTESAYNLDSEMDPFDKAEKERDSSGFFARFSAKIANIHSRREARLVRDEIILSRIPDKDLMEYLKLEQKRLESQQHAREIREKRIWIAFQMTIALIAAVLVIYFLKDSPAILISILYTAGLLIAFNIWNKHKDGRSPKDQ
ncbi:hypothetical protein [Dorea formicigenerans]|uniref:DUF2335 domain-containing protein n=1 Tax=Dorea formicigenerans TaxID=39486 RepID=A0A415ULZ6_9FIRM|nr:hypothetical protein [Dorea formicigenerans]RHN19104.1 hypothetical protein DWZ24_00645 [Dorea formicigenerans]